MYSYIIYTNYGLPIKRSYIAHTMVCLLKVPTVINSLSDLINTYCSLSIKVPTTTETGRSDLTYTYDDMYIRSTYCNKDSLSDLINTYCSLSIKVPAMTETSRSDLIYTYDDLSIRSTYCNKESLSDLINTYCSLPIKSTC